MSAKRPSLAVVLCSAFCPMLFMACSPAPTPMPNDNGTANQNENDNDNGSTTRQFAGAAACMTCHADSHADWSATAHAGALEGLRNIGQHENPVCLPCHTVGFEAGGYVDEATTPELAGVQCENCHGAAAEHAANPGDETLRPPLNMSASVCGDCHTDAHHPTFNEFELSGHARALEGLRLKRRFVRKAKTRPKTKKEGRLSCRPVQRCEHRNARGEVRCISIL